MHLTFILGYILIKLIIIILCMYMYIEDACTHALVLCNEWSHRRASIGSTCRKKRKPINGFISRNGPSFEWRRVHVIILFLFLKTIVVLQEIHFTPYVVRIILRLVVCVYSINNNELVYLSIIMWLLSAKLDISE
jgi:hypothetical protein